MSVATEKRCWSDIGVWSGSGPSCPVLHEVVHCRNCPVYTSQGRTLLDRPIPAGLRQEWTISVGRSPDEPGELSESVLIFRLGDEHFALPTRFFDEVISMRKVHTIPHRSGRVVKGFVAFRGRLELCVSMGNLLGVERAILAEEGPNATTNRIMVISRGDDARYLFPVSAVLGTYRYPVGDLEASFMGGAQHFFAYLKGIFPYQESTVGLMDPDLIFEALLKSFTAR